jgi:hypothetical protein
MLERSSPAKENSGALKAADAGRFSRASRFKRVCLGKRIESVSSTAQNSASVLRGRAYVRRPCLGGVAEWSIVPDSKSGVPQGTVGSNPTPSAMLRGENRVYTKVWGQETMTSESWSHTNQQSDEPVARLT